MPIARKMRLNSKSILFDLGCGTARFSFWLQELTQCKVVGIDLVEPFIEKAKEISQKLSTDDIKFIKCDMLKMDYSKATHIYFYSTSFEDDFIKKLTSKWSEELTTSTIIVTTSFELNDYCLNPEYKTLDEVKLLYPWGRCSVYIQQKL